VERVGAEIGDVVVDLNLAYAKFLDDKGDSKAYEIAALRIPNCMTGFLEGGAPSIAAAREGLDYVKNAPNMKGPREEKLVYKKDEVKLRVPLRPNKIMAVAVNHKKAIERLPQLPKQPLMFWKGGRTTVIASGDEIELTPESLLTHVEVELAVVIGKSARNVPFAKAYDYVAGYTILNDISAEDLVRAFKRSDKSYGEMMIGKKLPTEPEQFLKSGVTLTSWVENKNRDTFAPTGPCIVTRDEIPNPHDPPLRYESRVNGELVQEGTSADLYFTVPHQIEIFSRIMTLDPGDLISTGSVATLPPTRVLKHNDVVQARIDKIGTITNTCSAVSARA
jgi:acylpyruvate hydrolase